MDVNTMNQAFLAANPEIRKRLKKEYDKKHPQNWGTFRGTLKGAI